MHAEVGRRHQLQQSPACSQVPGVDSIPAGIDRQAGIDRLHSRLPHNLHHRSTPHHPQAASWDRSSADAQAVLAP